MVPNGSTMHFGPELMEEHPLVPTAISPGSARGGLNRTPHHLYPAPRRPLSELLFDCMRLARSSLQPLRLTHFSAARASAQSGREAGWLAGARRAPEGKDWREGRGRGHAGDVPFPSVPGPGERAPVPAA